MEKERERIERMLREGKITKEQSEKLLEALETSTATDRKIEEAGKAHGTSLEKETVPIKKKISGLAIASLVLAIFLGPLGLILGIIALKKITKSNWGWGMALAATIIGSLETLSIIVGVLMALVLPRNILIEEKFAEAAAWAEMDRLTTALEMYSIDCDSYPGGKETRAPVGFDALVNNIENKSDWEGPYVEEFERDVDGDNIPEDPWANEYEYEAATFNAQSFTIWCKGEDGDYKSLYINPGDFKNTESF